MDSFEPEPLDHQPAAPGAKRRLLSRAALIRLLIVAAVVIAAIAVATFFIQRRSNTSGSFHLGPVQVFNAKCSYDDASLCKFLNNWPNQKTYAVTSISQTAAGQAVTNVFKLVDDSKSQLSTVVAGKSTYDLITIGNTSYTKDYTDGKWWQQTSNQAQPVAEHSFQFNTNPDTNHPDAKPSYRFVSQGACGQAAKAASGAQNCLKYQVSFAGEDYQEFIWFDTSDFLLRQSTTQQANGPVTTLQYSYDNINIAAPSPTKKLPANQIAS